jgi:hypothetical protein
MKNLLSNKTPQLPMPVTTWADLRSGECWGVSVFKGGEIMFMSKLADYQELNMDFVENFKMWGVGQIKFFADELECEIINGECNSNRAMYILAAIIDYADDMDRCLERLMKGERNEKSQ